MYTLEYFEDFEKILNAYQKVPTNKEDEFINDLKPLSFIVSYNPISNNRDLKRPSEVYIMNPVLQEYFYGDRWVYFVSTELFDRFKVEEVTMFLEKVGCASIPRRIKIDGADLSWEQKARFRGNSRCSSEEVIDYDYDGLYHFLETITEERSYLLWSLLLKSLENFDD